MPSDDREETGISLKVRLFLWFWLIWATAMLARTWYISTTVDQAGLVTGLLVALVFGHVTLEGFFLFHWPLFAILGWAIGAGLVESQFPNAPRWVATLLIVFFTAFWLLLMAWGVANPGDCSPLTQFFCYG